MSQSEKKMEENTSKWNDNWDNNDNCIKDHPDCLYNWIIIGVICFLFIVVPSIGFMYCACGEKCCPEEASVDDSGGFSNWYWAECALCQLNLAWIHSTNQKTDLFALIWNPFSEKVDDFPIESEDSKKGHTNTTFIRTEELWTRRSIRMVRSPSKFPYKAQKWFKYSKPLSPRIQIHFEPFLNLFCICF